LVLSLKKLAAVAVVGLYAWVGGGVVSASNVDNQGAAGRSAVTVGLVLSEAKLLSVQDGVVVQVEVMTQGGKKEIKTGTAVPQETGKDIKASLRPGNLYEFCVSQLGNVIVADDPAATFQTLYSRGKPQDPLSWISDSAFVFDTKDYGMELSDGRLTAAGWIMGKTENSVTVGDGAGFNETYNVSSAVKVYEIHRGDYAKSRVTSFAAVQASAPETRKQAYLVFDRSYENSKRAKVVEIYYFAVDAPMPIAKKDLYVTNAQWLWGHEPFNLLGDVYCVGDKQVEIYLFNTAKGLVLLDTGWPQSGYQYAINIKKLGFDPRKINYILLSHAHLDHYGTVKEFTRINPKAKVLLSAEDYPYLRSQKMDVKIDGFYQYGQELDFGNIKLKPILTPGHTNGAISFVFDIAYNGKHYKAGYMGGYGTNGMSSADLKKSARPEEILLRRQQLLESLLHLQQNESVDLVAPQHVLSHYPLLQKWAKRVDGKNPFVDLDKPNGEQFVRQMERGIEGIKALNAADGIKVEPVSGVTGYVASEPKVIPGCDGDIGSEMYDAVPAYYVVQLNVISDNGRKNRVLRTTPIATLAEATALKDTIRLGDRVQFDVDEVGDIVLAAEPERTFRTDKEH